MSQKQNNTCALLLGMATQQLLPDAVRIESRATNTHFGYDFLYSGDLDDQVLPLIKQKLHQIIAQNLPFEVKTMMRENAAQLFLHHQLPLQAELITNSTDNLVQICQIGKSWFDRVPGDLLESSHEIGEMELTELQLFFTYYPTLGYVRVLRIGGVAFFERKELKAYRKQDLIAKKQDPVKLCHELNLIELEENMRPIWLPSGIVIRDLLLDTWKKKVLARDYQIISTPRIAEIKRGKKLISPLEELFPLFEQDHVEPPISSFEERDYSFHSPFSAHARLFEMQRQTKENIVFRTAEFYERLLPIYSKDSSQLWRSQTCFGDALHVFCGTDSLVKELISSLQFIKEISSLFPFSFSYSLFLPKQVRGKELFIEALENCGFQYTTEVATLPITGPRFEVQALDLRGKQWPFSIVGIDEYKKNEGKGAIWRIAKTLIFSLERLLALLVERGCGELPCWLAPIQVIVVPVHERHNARAKWLLEQLQLHAVRATIDRATSFSLSERIYACHRQKICFVVVIGDDEIKHQTFSVRCLATGEGEQSYSFDAFLGLIQRLNNA